jgi:hypothetical protein
VYFNCVQIYQSIVTDVTVEYGLMANPKFGRRLGCPHCEQQLRTSHLRADAGTYSAE